MPVGLIIFLVIAASVVVYLGIDYIVNRVVDKGADAISNALADRKNKKSSQEPENLADRFKK